MARRAEARGMTEQERIKETFGFTTKAVAEVGSKATKGA